MAGYGYSSEWSRFAPPKRPRGGHFDSAQNQPMFFNTPRMPLQNSSYGADYMKQDYVKQDYMKQEYVKQDYMKQEYVKQDYMKQDYVKQDYGKPGYGKQDFMKQSYMKQGYMKQDFVKPDYAKPDYMKPDYLSEDSGYYGGYYAGFRPAVPARSTAPSVPSYRGGGGIGSRGRSFPKKDGVSRSNLYPKPKKFPMKEKKYSAVGKTAAMVLNELYPTFKENCTYETLETPAKIPRFKCSFVVNEKTYSAEGSSKKIAKQLACEAALKELRPDITVEGSSFEKAEEEKMIALAEQAEKALKTTKRKAEPVKTSGSFHDYFLRVCREKEAATGEKYQPAFEYTQLPSSDSKPGVKKYLCALSFPDHGKRYTYETVNKVAGHNRIVKEALVDLFKVSPSDLKAAEQGAIRLRPGPPMQVLLQALNFYDRTVHIETDTADQKPVESNSRFVAKCVLDNEKVILGPPEESKQKAKDAVCIKVITEELGLCLPGPANAPLKRAATVLSPCYALHTLMMKQYSQSVPDVVYSEAIDISEGPSKPPLFKCTVTLNKKDVFEGIGQSKKAAKSAAAEKALQEHFKFDLLSESAVESLSSKRPRVDKLGELCNDVCSLVRNEYQSICQLQGCPVTTYISAFVIINPKGEKTMVALGAGRNAVVDGRALKASQGSLLIHMQSTVLARRAFLLYLHRQLEKADNPDSMFEKAESGKYRLKPDYKVVLYTSFPPNTARNPSERQPLTCTYGNGGQLGVTPDTVQNFEELASGGCVNVMSVADKMLKWNYLGVHGALLSYIIEPIFISYYFIAALSNERAVADAVLLRFQDFRKDEFVVRTGHTTVRPQGELYHNWVSEIGILERLDPSTGRTVSGAPSRLSKSELFESWNRLLTAIGGSEKRLSWTCAEAKKAETIYSSAVSKFYEELKTLGFGVWQKKDSCVDDFTLASFDC